MEATGRVRVPRRKLCTGPVELRVLGAGHALKTRTTKLGRDCTYALAVPAPRGARLRATVGFGGNDHLLPRLIGPRPVR